MNSWGWTTWTSEKIPLELRRIFERWGGHLTPLNPRLRKQFESNCKKFRIAGIPIEMFTGEGRAYDQNIFLIKFSSHSRHLHCIDFSPHSFSLNFLFCLFNTQNTKVKRKKKMSINLIYIIILFQRFKMRSYIKLEDDVACWTHEHVPVSTTCHHLKHGMALVSLAWQMI
jgi:hypothetical protein